MKGVTLNYLVNSIYKISKSICDLCGEDFGNTKESYIDMLTFSLRFFKEGVFYIGIEKNGFFCICWKESDLEKTKHSLRFMVLKMGKKYDVVRL